MTQPSPASPPLVPFGGAFTVTRRPQPLGEKGVRWSLEEVARRATKARLDPHVRAWTVQTLKRAKDEGKSIVTPMERARVLLAAVRRDFIYLPDPSHSEMMVAPEYLVQGIIPGGDCDDLSSFVIAAFLSVLGSAGVRSAVVGHAYDRDKQIQHVLGAVHIDNRWWYADPSTDSEFGEWKVPPSRERVIDVPCEDDAPAFCDAERCLTGLYAMAPPLLTRDGDFVGVDGLPAIYEGYEVTEVTETLATDAQVHVAIDEACCFLEEGGWLVEEIVSCDCDADLPAIEDLSCMADLRGVPPPPPPPPPPPSSLGKVPNETPEAVQAAMAPVWGQYLASVTENLATAYDTLQASYQQLAVTAQQLGAPFATSSPGAIWPADADQAMANVWAAAEVALAQLEGTLTGKRRAFALADGDIGIEQLPTDRVKVVLPATLPTSLASLRPELVPLPPPPGVGFPPALAAALIGAIVPLAYGAAASAVVLAVGAAVNLAALCRAATAISDNATRRYMVEAYAAGREKGLSHEELVTEQQLVTNGQVHVSEARAKEADAQGRADAAKPNALADTLTAAAWLAGLGGAVYVVYELAQASREGRLRRSKAA